MISLGVAELRPLLEHLGHEVSEERLQEVMKKFDVNGDGELCKKEVRAMVDELKESVIFCQIMILVVCSRNMASLKKSE